jgi:hypothetical protein
LSESKQKTFEFTKGGGGGRERRGREKKEEEEKVFQRIEIS